MVVTLLHKLATLNTHDDGESHQENAGRLESVRGGLAEIRLASKRSKVSSPNFFTNCGLTAAKYLGSERLER
jgi:hypothetical protein